MELALNQTADGLSVIYSGGDFVSDPGGLLSSVLLSIFTPDWWGNSEASETQKLNSKINQVILEFRGDALINELEEVIKQQLSWMISERIAGDVRVEVTAETLYKFNVLVSLFRPDQNIRFDLNWSALSQGITA